MHREKGLSAAAASDDRRQLCAAARAEKSARVIAENTTGWTLADFQEALMSYDLRSVLPDFFCGGADGRTHASQLLVYGDEYGVRDFITCENTDYAEDQNYDRSTFNKMMLSIQPSVSDLTAALVNHTMTRTMADRITGPIKPVASTGLLFVKAL